MPIRTLTENGEHSWPAILTAEPLLVIYKHSPTCGVSSVTRPEVGALGDAMPSVPVYQVDVLRQRDLSEAVANELGVGHESPQVILVCDGRAAWSASHFSIKAATVKVKIERALEACALRRPSEAGTAG